MNPQNYLQTFAAGYFEALLWAEHDIDDKDNDTLGDIYGIKDIAGLSRDEARAECADFLAQAGDLLLSASTMGEYRDVYEGRLRLSKGFKWAGRDFLLTRNGHGVGFWNRRLPDHIANELSDIAESFGSVYVFSNGTNTLHIEKG